MMGSVAVEHRWGQYRRRVLAIALSVCSIGGAAGCGSDGGGGDAGPTVEGRAEGPSRIVRWEVGKVLGPQSLEIGSVVGYCQGAPKPHYGDIGINETGRKVYVTARAVFPPEGRKGLCQGVGLSIFKAIKLRRNVASIEIYDTHSKPAQLRWNPLPPVTSTSATSRSDRSGNEDNPQDVD